MVLEKDKDSGSVAVAAVFSPRDETLWACVFLVLRILPIEVLTRVPHGVCCVRAEEGDDVLSAV